MDEETITVNSIKYWKESNSSLLEIFLPNGDLIIVADLKSKQIDKKSKNLLFTLKEKAFLEVNAEEPFYPLIFVETLNSLVLTVNSRYYADFFRLY